MKVNPIRSYIQAQNKNFLPIFLILGVCVLIAFVILPQISSFNSLRDQISQKQEHIQTVQNSLKLLSQQSDAALDSDFSLIDTALPSTKRVVNIFNSLANASTKSNVVMKSFQVKVGSVYSKSSTHAASNQQIQSAVKGVPYLTVDTQVESDNERKIVKFIDSLSTLFPLSEINTTDITDNTGNIEIRFFYKPYNIDQLAHQEELQPISATDQKTLSEIKGWGQN